MQKIFINKITHMVEQILKEEEGEIIGKDYFPNCYMIEDIEENINAYNLRHNEEEGTFEVIEGMPPKAEVEIIEKVNTEDIENIKRENEDLKTRLEKLEKLLKV